MDTPLVDNIVLASYEGQISEGWGALLWILVMNICSSASGELGEGGWIDRWMEGHINAVHNIYFNLYSKDPANYNVEWMIDFIHPLDCNCIAGSNRTMDAAGEGE